VDFQAMNNPLLYTIAFSQMHGISPYFKSLLIKTFGSANAIYQERQRGGATFKKIEKLNLEPIMAAWPLKAAATELETITRMGIEATCLEDAAYPNRLFQCDDAPIILFSKGSKKWNLPFLVSIVGTRNHSMYAEKVIQELLEGIAHLNLGVISGLALGVDGIVHQKACQLKIPNWGVMATGMDEIYPTQHHTLAIKMMEHGGILTENTTETAPLPFQFPKRNRIVAGMSDATIVIESAVQGGSMITAGLARGYNREVFAVPGKIFDLKSRGCLTLVHSNMAQVYQSPTQLLECLGWAAPATILTSQQPIPFALTPICQEILAYITSQGPIHRDQLANRFNLNIALLSTHLLTLELNGLILPHGGAFYSKR
jgi:DNA processing protein